MRALVLLVLLLSPVARGGDEAPVPQSFASLTHARFDDTADVYFDPATTKVVNKPLPDSPVGEIVAVETRFGSERYTIVFDPGPSYDPAFRLHKGGPDGPVAATLAGERLYLPGSTSFYVSGRANQMFETRRKFVVANGAVTEVKQPYLYVGLQTTVQNPSMNPVEAQGPYTLTLYADKAQKQVVAALPSGSEIEVLLADGEEWYLVRTSFGLVGWAHVPHAMKTPIGVYYAGD